MKKCKPLVSLLCILLLAGSALGLAQQETGTITGEIKDTIGAMIPKASITITNLATNINVTTESNESGLYTVTSLRPGIYTVAVEKAGFRRVTLSQITLQVN